MLVPLDVGFCHGYGYIVRGAAETGSFLWPSVKVIRNQLALAIIRTTSSGMC